MLYSAGLTTSRILDVFTDEVTARGGRVTDTFDDGRRLFTRSVLPHVEDVRPGDRLQGGVALKAAEDVVWLYPYVFRLVCRNGAIMAQALESRHLAELHVLETEYALESLREGVGACCGREVFAGSVGRMRTACEAEADLALNLMPLLSRFAGRGDTNFLAQILDHFLRDGDQSRFGLVNAVTATAREVRDPVLRWDLEEFGGGVAAASIPGPSPHEMPAAARPRAAAAVG